ncbi:hypothetical protein KKF04_04645, partial [Patescibacteria group bacterium]|nr:hypothetical protein [Patescibacteria group bacterium]
DGLSSAENIVNAINNSEFQISANNIDFSDLENAIYSYTFDLNEAEDFSYEGEDLILLENGEIKVAEDGFISVFAKYSDGEKIAYKPIDGIYSPADDLLYIASYSGARVYGVDPDTKQIVHEIGMNGYGNGGISNAYHVDVTEDGLMMAVTSSSHFVSVWKRASLEDSWHFEFDLGTPNSYGNVSDGSKFRSTYSAVIRNSDEHIFVGSYYGITADFNANSTGYGGVVEFDSDGNFVDIPLHIGSKGGNGTILQGEARYVYGLAFDENENLWVSTNDNQIGRFDSSTWELQKTITSNEVTGDYINSPYKIEILNEDTLAIRNNQTHQMQIWSVDGQLLRSVGYAEYSDSALAFVTLFGFLTDPEGDLYVMNYTNDNIQKINYSKVGTNSRLIFPIITLETAQRLERLLLNKKQIGSFNNISFQYRLDEGDGWEDMPEDYDLSDVDFGDNQIQISAVFEPELQSNATYSSDIIDSVQIEYSVIE